MTRSAADATARAADELCRVQSEHVAALAASVRDAAAAQQEAVQVERSRQKAVHEAVALKHSEDQSAAQHKQNLHADKLSAAVADARISDDPVEATYHLATLAPVGEADRYRLLAAPGPIERLEVLDDVLDDVEAMLRFRLGDGEPR